MQSHFDEGCKIVIITNRVCICYVSTWQSPLTMHALVSILGRRNKYHILPN